MGKGIRNFISSEVTQNYVLPHGVGKHRADVLFCSLLSRGPDVIC